LSAALFDRWTSLAHAIGHNWSPREIADELDNNARASWAM
jgi:hypothetical protein